MTKQIDPAGSGAANPGLEESFFEQLDQFADGVRKIDERFQNRLTGKVLLLGEDYINNRFGLVLKLHRRGQSHGQWVALCLYAAPPALNEAAAIAADELQLVFEGEHVSSGEKEAMLVDIVELVEAPDKRRAIRSFCWFNLIQDEALGLWEGHIYRRPLGNASFDVIREILPCSVSWKGRSGKGMVVDRDIEYFMSGSIKSRPKVVCNAVDVVNSIASQQEEVDVQKSPRADCHPCGIRVVIDGDNIHIFSSDAFNELFDKFYVLLGPFNLEF